MERVSKDNNCTLETSGKATKCINVGSYNYLGYADDWKETCAEEVLACTENWPASMASARMDFGTTALLTELEQMVAQFVGKEAALITPMGYNTNVVTLAALMGEGTLIVSDNLNHTSLVNGARNSAAQIRVFRSNDLAHLEEVLQEAIVKGQPRHHRPWRKILVVVEGIYSMEGAICKLKEIVEVTKKYRCYIYVDEAHSIGALGNSGRGVCEYAGVDPADINVLMGTFTKSFSGMGGYIAADRKTIEYLRATSEGILYHNAMSPVVTQQVISAFKVIMGTDGTDIGQKKIASLRDNSNYFRDKLTHMGVHVYGDYDSPIIPVMIYMPCKIAAFSRECLKRGLAVVVVGFPATPLVLSRARFCISAGHTREDLDKALAIVEEVTELMMMRYGRTAVGL
jgi:serine palmitoyltransferase